MDIIYTFFAGILFFFAGVFGQHVGVPAAVVQEPVTNVASSTSLALENNNTEYKVSDFTWLIQDLGDTGTYGEPYQKVILKIDGTHVHKYVVGDYYMNCSEQNGTEYKGTGKVSKSVRCWWAGAGKEIAVFLENGKYVVKIANLDEGSAYVASPSVVFKTQLEVK